MNLKQTKLACYIGYIVQAIINNFLPILFIVFQTNLDLTYEQLGRIVFINFFTQLLSDAVTPSVVKRIGYKGCAVLCHIFVTTGLIMLTVLTGIMSNTYLALIISVVVYAFGSGMIEVVISPIMELLPTENKAKNMAFLHSFYCWGQTFTVAVTTFMVLLLGYGNWRFIPLVWAIVPLFNTVLFLKVTVIEPNEVKGSFSNRNFLSKEFICFIIFMICAGASEISMASFASVFAQNALGVSKLTGDLLGPCSFAVCMGIGRVLYGAFSDKISIKKALILNNILCVICYLTVAFTNINFLSLVFCALCGFSVSLLWPGTYSLAAKRFGGGNTVMFSIFALCGDIGCSAGPWLLGYIADVSGSLKKGFAVCTVFPLVMILAALTLIKEKDCKV
ncbi:MAG: MFS transporter [Clostridia bacterium]|nr:MFS transporter [Clostridia bacterium]